MMRVSEQLHPDAEISELLLSHLSQTLCEYISFRFPDTTGLYLKAKMNKVASNIPGEFAILISSIAVKNCS